MIKEDYLKELTFPKLLKKGSPGKKNIEKVQEWLNLNQFYLKKTFKCNCAIDGDFGPQTEKAVKAFQEIRGIEVTGIVDEDTWDLLVEPMSKAFNSRMTQARMSYREKDSVRDAILVVAKQHLECTPRELNSKNEGPWVRAYMGGHDGNPWAWCVGSALTILDQALSVTGLKFTDHYPDTYSCDVMGNHAKKKKTLIRNKDLQEMSLTDLYKNVQPGDLLQVVKTPTDWTHCAIILQVHDDHFVTAEGNTNDEGSREGFEFVKRKRYFRRNNLDVLTLKLK